MHRSRFSVEGVLDAPDSTAARPALRLRIAGIAVLGLFGLLGLRLWTLQVLQAPAAVQAVTANQIRAVPVAPTRGFLLDRYGNPLVNNVVTEQITMSRVTAQLHPDVVGRLAAVVGETTEQVNASIANPRYSPYKPVPVMSNAPPSTILYIKEHQDDFPGVESVETTQRNYPQTELPGPASAGYPVSQSLGYVGTINAAELKSRASQGYQAGDAFGQSGLEYQYESELRGAPGQQQLEVDSKGRVVGTLKATPATPGDNIVTNIDTNLQQVADNALASQVAALRHSFDSQCNKNAGCTPAATGGAVIVMNPQTGAVDAMSSYPTYSPSVWVGGITPSAYASLSDPAFNKPLINRAIAGVYTPGSTFKLNTATAALNLGLPDATRYYDDTNTFTVPNCIGTSCKLHNAEGDRAFGEINLTTALTVSSDDFFYNLGAQFYLARGSPAFGATPIQDQAGQYSLGQLTGIDLLGESVGRVDSQMERLKLHAENPTAFPTTTWYTGDNVEMAFGQGATEITPIEQAVAYATFANGGTRFAPQVAAAIVSPDGTVVKRMAPQVTGRVNLPPSTFDPMLAGFEGAIQQQGGTAYLSFLGSKFPVNELAGKTGTADTVAGKEPTAWFVAWGPTADPQYVVVCVIDQAGYGAAASAPVVKTIFDYLSGHPVTAPGIPPVPQNVEANRPVTLPTPSTTTTTTSVPSGRTGTTSTTSPPSTTTPTTLPHG
jgi:penicillin-binding protein 2